MTTGICMMGSYLNIKIAKATTNATPLINIKNDNNIFTTILDNIYQGVIDTNPS